MTARIPKNGDGIIFTGVGGVALAGCSARDGSRERWEQTRPRGAYSRQAAPALYAALPILPDPSGISEGLTIFACQGFSAPRKNRVGRALRRPDRARNRGSR